MEQVNYYDLESLLIQCSNGSVDMHEPIEVTNIMKNKKIEISLLKHFLILCKTNNISLIHILSTLRYKIKTNLLTLLDSNYYFNQYVEGIIKEWSLNISPEELLMDGLDQCNYKEGDDIINYEDLLSENKLTQQGGSKFKLLEEAIQNRLDSRERLSKENANDINSKIKILYNECQDCATRIKHNIADTSDKHHMIEPKYRDILLDLSTKSKSTYLEYLNRIRPNESKALSLFLSELQDLELPDHIHTIFLNYVITLNMIKKELNYINNSYKKLLSDVVPNISVLGKFINGHPEINELIVKDDDNDDNDEKQTNSILGFSFF